MKTLYKKEEVIISGWEREEPFRYFSSFSQPFFAVQTELEITGLYRYCKAHNISIFLGYLYVSLKAARAIENFRLRIESGKVFRYQGLDLSTTVLRDDGNLSFVHLPYRERMEDFCKNGSEIISKVKVSKNMFHGYNGPDLLHLTTLPWFRTMGIQHASTLDPADAIPKFAFGRLEFINEKVMLPLNISLHHALADAFHVHLFLEEMKKQVTHF